MKLRVCIGNLRHVVVHLLRLESAEPLNTLAQLKRLHPLAMGPVIYLVVSWLVMEVKEPPGLLLRRRRSSARR